MQVRCTVWAANIEPFGLTYFQGKRIEKSVIQQIVEHNFTARHKSGQNISYIIVVYNIYNDQGRGAMLVVEVLMENGELMLL